MKIYRLLLLIHFFGVMHGSGYGQQKSHKHSLRYYSKHPAWIDMMNDEHANYNETIKAFKYYWKNRALPKEAFDNGTEEFEKMMGLSESDEKETEENKKGTGAVSYAAEVLAFKGWIQSNQSWVKADGSIMTTQERQDLINNQQSELKEVERKNGKK